MRHRKMFEYYVPSSEQQRAPCENGSTLSFSDKITKSLECVTYRMDIG